MQVEEKLEEVFLCYCIEQLLHNVFGKKQNMLYDAVCPLEAV